MLWRTRLAGSGVRRSSTPTRGRSLQALPLLLRVLQLGSGSRWTDAAAGWTTCSSSWLWRSLKHEEVYLKGYADGREARAGIAAWIAFYNTRRPHQALGGQTPLVVWRTGTSDALGARAVDLTLRLDNAGALPTGPQPHEQRQALVA